MTTGGGNNQVQIGDGNDASVSIQGNGTGNNQVQIGDGNNASVAIVGTGNQNVHTGKGSGTVTLTGTKNNVKLGSAGWSVVVPTSTSTSGVTFKDGTTTLGTGTLIGGVATFSTSTLSAGTHAISAYFGGVVASANLIEVVNKASSTTTTVGAGPFTYTGMPRSAGRLR